MALLIWCNPKYFPAELRGRAVATLMAVLNARGVTLEQVRDVQANVDRTIDSPGDDDEPVEGDAELFAEWEDAWFAAIAAAEADLNLPATPLGAMLVLDESDARFGHGLH